MSYDKFYDPFENLAPVYFNPKAYNSMLFLTLIGSVSANFVMYLKVVRTAFNQLKSIESSGSSMGDETAIHELNTKKKSIKKTKMMILVLGVFAICWGPYCIAIVFEALFLEPSDTFEVVKKFLSCFGVLNSGLNWIIFGLKNTTYRNAFKYILCCGKGVSDSSLMISSSAK